ncbi:MAG: hypothetical protein ABJB40_13060 [Acidobacteriota bacterium]
MKKKKLKAELSKTKKKLAETKAKLNAVKPAYANTSKPAAAKKVSTPKAADRSKVESVIKPKEQPATKEPAKAKATLTAKPKTAKR